MSDERAFSILVSLHTRELELLHAIAGADDLADAILGTVQRLRSLPVWEFPEHRAIWLGLMRAALLAPHDPDTTAGPLVLLSLTLRAILIRRHLRAINEWHEANTYADLSGQWGPGPLYALLQTKSTAPAVIHAAARYADSRSQLERLNNAR